jgi:hypothetical protein
LNAQTLPAVLFSSNSNIGFNLAPMQEQNDPETEKARQEAADASMRAGLSNTAFGWWSWAHGDTFGGALTAGLEIGGFILMITSSLTVNVNDGTDNLGLRTAMIFGGVGMWIGGMFFGYFRGLSQYKIQNAAAKGFDGNPLAHVSFGIVPGVGGTLMYTARF